MTSELSELKTKSLHEKEARRKSTYVVVHRKSIIYIQGRSTPQSKVGKELAANHCKFRLVITSSIVVSSHHIASQVSHLSSLIYHPIPHIVSLPGVLHPHIPDHHTTQHNIPHPTPSRPNHPPSLLPRHLRIPPIVLRILNRTHTVHNGTLTKLQLRNPASRGVGRGGAHSV